MQCVLNDNKVCDNCGECNRCDLDPNKICDNCCKCLQENNDAAYAMIPVSDVVLEQTEEYLSEYYREEDEAERQEDE